MAVERRGREGSGSDSVLLDEGFLTPPFPFPLPIPSGKLECIESPRRDQKGGGEREERIPSPLPPTLRTQTSLQKSQGEKEGSPLAPSSRFRSLPIFSTVTTPPWPGQAAER